MIGRRQFLRGGVVLGASLVVLPRLGWPGLRAAGAAAPPAGAAAPASGAAIPRPCGPPCAAAGTP